MMQGELGVIVRGRVEIDTRRPFRSVREAVALFGEKILAGEVNKLKEIQSKASDSDLKETRQSLANKEEKSMMAQCLESLRQELEQTKKELYQLKAREEVVLDLDDKPEIEEIKFVENTTKSESSDDDDNSSIEYHRKRSVKFASPPLLNKVIITSDDDRINGEVQAKAKPLVSKKKIKKKPLVPLIGGLFSKKGSNDGAS